VPTTPAIGKSGWKLEQIRRSFGGVGAIMMARARGTSAVAVEIRPQRARQLPGMLSSTPTKAGAHQAGESQSSQLHAELTQVVIPEGR
jgi:hypothetical protein